MSFYLKISKRVKSRGFWVIRWKPGTPIDRLFRIRDDLMNMRGRLFNSQDEGQPIIQTLNNALEELRLSVVIIFFRRGSEGRGFSYYAIERFLDHKFFVKPDTFSTKISEARSFDNPEDAKEEAINLGYNILKDYNIPKM